MDVYDRKTAAALAQSWLSQIDAGKLTGAGVARVLRGFEEDQHRCAHIARQLGQSNALRGHLSAAAELERQADAIAWRWAA